jgi:transposase-like protein
MDPATVFCPNRACPARGQVGQGNIGIHSRKDKRFVCTQCHRTVTVQVVTTGITPQLAPSERLREAETEPRHPAGPRHTPR